MSGGERSEGSSGYTLRCKSLVKRSIPQRLICRRGRAAGGYVGLSFDDGPCPGRTERVLDLLEQSNSGATFFVIGQRVQEHPELARRIHDQGHELGNHSHSHPYFTRLDSREMGLEISRADAAIAAVTGCVPRYFRPPCGTLSVRLLWRLFAARRLPVLLWTHALGGDESIYDPSCEQILQHLASIEIRAGDILLLHDTNEHTVEALPAILADLHRRELRGVAVGQLLDPRASARHAELPSSQTLRRVIRRFT